MGQFFSQMQGLAGLQSLFLGLMFAVMTVSAMDQQDTGFVLNIMEDLGDLIKRRQKSWDISSANNGDIREDKVIDFGLGRGYSGSEAARYKLGLQRANFAFGPGKRKRSFMGQDPYFIHDPIYPDY